MTTGTCTYGNKAGMKTENYPTMGTGWKVALFLGLKRWRRRKNLGFRVLHFWNLRTRLGGEQIHVQEDYSTSVT